MLAVKLLGGALIVGAGGLVARFLVRAERHRLAVLDEWIGLILYIRGQIDCYLTPLDVILSHLPPHLCQTHGGGRCTNSLDERYQATAPALGAEARELLGGFLREIGDGYREEQLRRCDYYLSALGKVRQALGNELPSRLRLCTTLCLCMAIGATILLW